MFFNNAKDSAAQHKKSLNEALYAFMHGSFKQRDDALINFKHLNEHIPRAYFEVLLHDEHLWNRNEIYGEHFWGSHDYALHLSKRLGLEPANATFRSRSDNRIYFETLRDVDIEADLKHHDVLIRKHAALRGCFTPNVNQVNRGLLDEEKVVRAAFIGRDDILIPEVTLDVILINAEKIEVDALIRRKDTYEIPGRLEKIISATKRFNDETRIYLDSTLYSIVAARGIEVSEYLLQHFIETPATSVAVRLMDEREYTFTAKHIDRLIHLNKDNRLHMSNAVNLNIIVHYADLITLENVGILLSNPEELISLKVPDIKARLEARKAAEEIADTIDEALHTRKRPRL